MERLIADAAKLDSSIQANDLSFGNIVKAIHAVQNEMGITGTTALEAGRTISGSVASMKAAWTNLITGISDKSADLEELVDNLVTSVVGDGTENNLGVFGNIMPAVETALNGAGELVERLFPEIIKRLPKILKETLPELVQGAMSVVESLIYAISENSNQLSDSIVSAITSILMHAAQNTPKLIGGVLDLILAIIKELGNNLGTIVPELITSITNVTTEIAKRAPELTDAVLAVIDGIINVLTSPEGIVKMTVAGFQLLFGLISGIVGSVPKLIGNILMIVPKIADSFLDADWKGVGKNIVDGIWGGLKNNWENLKKWFTDAWEDLVGGVKDLLGIHSPSRVFAGIGRNMALGVGEGWDDEFGDVEKGINGSMAFDDATFGVSSYSGGGMLGGFGGTTFGTVNINIDGANVQDPSELADMVAERLQEMTERRGAVFA